MHTAELNKNFVQVTPRFHAHHRAGLRDVIYTVESETAVLCTPQCHAHHGVYRLGVYFIKG